MRFPLLTAACFALILCGRALAQSPPFPLVTVTGETDPRFNKVSLFESGGATIPLKSATVSEAGGQYSIDVNIPEDMRQKGQYYFTDMLFWNDGNGNDVRDPGEPTSECHFIMWVPGNNSLYMQVYEGEKYPIESAIFYYHYQKR